MDGQATILRGRQSIARKAAEHIAEQIDEGTLLICQDHDPAEVFSTVNEDVINTVSFGEVVEASGKPIELHGYMIVPIKPQGAVQLDLFDMVDEPSATLAGQRKVYARESVVSLGISIVGHPPEQVFIESVTEGGWAESQGLAVDDEVLAINGMEVAQLTDTRFIQHLRARPCLMTLRKTDTRASEEQTKGKKRAFGLGRRLAASLKIRGQATQKAPKVRTEDAAPEKDGEDGAPKEDAEDAGPEKDAEDDAPKEDAEDVGQPKDADDAPEKKASDDAVQRLVGNIDDGVVLMCTHNEDKMVIYASSDSHDVIGHFAVGDTMEASGQAEYHRGVWMVPIKPQGAVELELFEISNSSNELPTQMNAEGPLEAQITSLESRLRQALAEYDTLKAEHDEVKTTLSWLEEKSGQDKNPQEVAVQAIAEVIDGKRWSTLSWIQREEEAKKGEQEEGGENTVGEEGASDGAGSTKIRTTILFTAEEDVEDLGFQTKGQPPELLVISDVTAEGWAKSVGIVPEDEILEINDMKIADLNMEEVKTSMNARPLKLLVRGAPEVTEEDTKVAVANEEDATLGVTFVPMPPEPVFAKKVRGGTWAHKAGMVPGSEILSLNEQDVEVMDKKVFLDMLRQRPLTIKFILPVKAWGKVEAEKAAPKDPREEELERREAQLLRRERELNAAMLIREEELLPKMQELQRREEDLLPREEKLKAWEEELQPMEERLKAWEEELSQREEQLKQFKQELEGQFNERNQQLDEREQQLHELQEELELREEQVTQQEEDLEGIGEKLKKRKKKLNERENDLDLREQELNDLEQRLKDWEKELHEREAACGLAEELARKKEEERMFLEAMAEAEAVGEPEPEEDGEDLLESNEWILKAKEDVRYLGFTPEILPSQSWAYIRKVVVGRWADKKGLVEDDLLVAIDGKDLLGIQSNAQLLKALEKRPIELSVSREGAMDPMDERPVDKAFDCIAGYEDRPLGLTPLTFPPGRVFVESVSSSGWAARHGIQRGAEIMLANGQRASKMSAEDFRNMMRVRPLQLRIKPITASQVEPDEQLEKLSLDEISKPLGLVFAEMLPWKLAVQEVLANSWAEQCVIEEGSEISHVNDKDIIDMSLLDLKKALRVQPLRFKLSLPQTRTIREVRAEKVDMDLGWHITFDDDLGLVTSDGLVQSVFLDEIYKGGWAYRKCLKAGSEILAINGEDVSTMTPDHLKEMFEHIRPLRIKICPPVDKRTNFEYAPEKVHHKALLRMKNASKRMGAGGNITKRNVLSEAARNRAGVAEESDGSNSSLTSSAATPEEDDGMMSASKGRGRKLEKPEKMEPEKMDEEEQASDGKAEEMSASQEDRRQSEDVPSMEILLKVAPHPDIVKVRAEQEEEARRKELQAYLDRIRESEEYIFKHFDEDKLGMVSYEEFRHGLDLLNVHLSDESFKKLMEELDPQETGHIPYEGFHSRVGIHRWEQGGAGGHGQIDEDQEELNEEKRKEAEQEKKEMRAFKKGDEDASGKLSYDELRDMHKDLSDDEFADLMQKIDMDGDGSITLNEYMNRHLALQEHEFQQRMEEVQQQFREREEEYFRSQLDIDGSGKLTKDEVRVQRPDLSPDEFEAMWKQLDSDNNGFITKGEWIAYQEEQVDQQILHQEKEVLKSFNKVDQDKSGRLTELELRAMHADLSDKEFKKMMRKLDRDGDGSVSKQEYLKLQEMERRQQAADQRNEELTSQELALFSMGDSDLSGRITFEELKNVHPEKTEQELMNLWRRIDKDKDGTVTKEEWLKQFRLTDEERENRKAFEDLMQEVELRDAELFSKIDAEGSGQLALEEFHQGLYPQLDSAKFQDILDKEKIDKESKGFVTLPEFLARYREINLQEKEPLLRRLEQLDFIECNNFLSFDLDASGRLSIQEMHDMYPDMTDGDFAEMVRKIDREGDGLITVQEFLCRHVADEDTLEDRLLTSHRCCIMVELHEREADVEQREDDVGLLYDELRAQFKSRSETADRRDEAADKRDQDFEEYARKREEDLWVQEQWQRAQLDDDVRRCKDRELALVKREEEVLQFMSDTFRTFDTDDSGCLTYNEFKPAMRRMGWEVSDDELFAMMRELDEDGDGTVNYQEFVKVYGLERQRQERREKKKEEPDEFDKGHHNKRIVYQDWQRQEYHLRRVEEAKLHLEQQRKKDEFERSLNSEAGALSTVLRLAMEHFVLLGAGVASLADSLGEDLQQQALQIVLEHAVPCVSYHAGIKDLCTDLQKKLEDLDREDVPKKDFLNFEEPKEESKEEDSMHAVEDVHKASGDSLQRMVGKVNAGTALICNHDEDDMVVYASLDSHEVIGHFVLGEGERVEASGPPKCHDGAWMVPILPEGAVELKLFNIAEGGKEPSTQKNKHGKARTSTQAKMSEQIHKDHLEERELSIPATLSERPSIDNQSFRMSVSQREVAIDSIYSTKRTAVDIAGGAFAAVLTDGSVVAWGHATEGGDCSHVAEELASGVRKVYATAHAFAALKDHGSVVAWGNAANGGEPGATRQYILSDVQVVYSTDSAFAALKGCGAVYTWGNARSGGESSMVKDQLRGGVKSVFSTSQAFAALKLDGSVCTWGHPQFGGDSLDIAEDLEMNVSRIYSTASAFAAVKFFGSVHTWGSPIGGADMSYVCEKLSKQVHQVFSTANAFAAVKRDGSVVTWGHPEFGGDCEDVREHLRGVKRIYATEGAFAALKKGGAVSTWGSHWYGGDSSAVRSHLVKGVAGVYSTLRAFAAIKADGAICTWGSEQAGGDSSKLQIELRKGVRQVHSTTLAFAVVKTSGRVLTWGSAAAGGDSSAVQAHLKSGVLRIYATARAFVAVLQDGTVQTWGNPDFGGDSSTVRDHLQRMLRIARPQRLRQPGARGSIVRRSSLLPGAARHSLRVGASASGESAWAGEAPRTSGIGSTERSSLKKRAIFVTICSAQNLRDADTFGKSDPFCVCEAGNGAKFQTPVISDTLNPEWNFRHEIDYSGEELTFAVWDDDMMDDLLGRASLAPEAFAEKGFGGELELSDPKRKKGSKAATLRVQVDLTGAGNRQNWEGRQAVLETPSESAGLETGREPPQDAENREDRQNWWDELKDAEESLRKKLLGSGVETGREPPQDAEDHRNWDGREAVSEAPGEIAGEETETEPPNIIY